MAVVLPFVLGAGASSLVTSTLSLSKGFPAERGAIETVPYVPLLKNEGFRVDVEWMT